MLTIPEMFSRVSRKSTEKMRRLCEPVERFFGVKCFFMSTTLPDGRFFSISNNPAFQEYYFSNENFVSSPFFRNPAFIKSGFYSYRQYENYSFQKSIDLAVEATNLELVAGIAVNKNNTLTRFGYATKPYLVKGLNSLLVNNLFVLKKFNEHILAELNEVLPYCAENAASLPQIMGEQYNLPIKNYIVTTLSVHEQIAFLKKIGVYPHVKNITKRELDYFHYISKGYTGRQIAANLNVSQRTVEHCINTLKNKFGCSSKTELIEIARLLNF